MNLIDEERSKFLFDNINSPKVISGGSAANTAVGLASLGSTAAFIGKVKNDELGNTFKRDIEEVGVSFDTPLIVPRLVRSLFTSQHGEFYRSVKAD